MRVIETDVHTGHWMCQQVVGGRRENRPTLSRLPIEMEVGDAMPVRDNGPNSGASRPVLDVDSRPNETAPCEVEAASRQCWDLLV